MRFIMRAYVQGTRDPGPTRIREWDYIFEIASEEEADEQGDEISDAFDSHDNNDVKWVEGPFRID